MAEKKEQRTSQIALEALKDLMIHNILPDRRLRRFEASIAQHFPKVDMKTALLLWYEGKLIDRFERVVSAIELALKSNIEYFKKNCMSIATELLINKPEQEARLLSMLVNKLGDPVKSISSKCIELLRSVVKKHPAMKNVVVKEVRQFIYRPSTMTAPKAMYTGMNFLSQVLRCL
jgi:ribosome biogenesis protein MAK21